MPAILLLSGMPAFAGVLTYTFSTDPPNGTIAGLAGSTIGWGYSITNQDPTNWLLTTNLTSAPFADGTPDASVFDFPVVAPLATVALPFDPVAPTGLFALTWDFNAPVGFSNSGVFTLSAEWWTGDPSAGGGFLQAAADGSVPYSATVSSPNGAVPEPNPFWLLMAVLVGASLIIRKRSRHLESVSVEGSF